MMNLLLMHFACLFINFNSVNAVKNPINIERSVASDTSAIIKKIRLDFSTINSRLTSYKKKSKDVFDMSAEGGEVTGYYDKALLVKLHSVFYGETGKVEIDYYFNKEGLFFLYKKETFYDKPIYVKGFKIKNIEENRFYFYKNELIRWLVNKTVSPKSKTFKEVNDAINKEVREMKGVLARKRT
jgi:hypothetical protein